MPTYDYRCETCGGAFEFQQSFSDDALTRCPGKRSGGPVTEACTAPGKGRVTKVFGAVGIAFKGDGFYKNDHGSGAKRSETAASSGEKAGSSSSESSAGSTEKASTEKAGSSSAPSSSGD